MRRGTWLGLAIGAALAAVAVAEGPSFDCTKASSGAEKAICADPGLAALDRKLHAVFTEALAKAKDGMPQVLKTEQRGWIKGRDECWKAQEGSPTWITESWTVSNEKACLSAQHRLRIAELQAVWRLVPARGPVFHACGGSPANELVVTYFESELKALRAERGDRTVTAYFVDAAPGGGRYEGQNFTLRARDGGVDVTWLGETLGCKAK